jgi:hypothetical protein
MTIEQNRFFIGGDFVPPHGDERAGVINPATDYADLAPDVEWERCGAPG